MQVRDHPLPERRGHRFIAEVPELPGCMAHGDSQDAPKNVNEAMRLWIETAREFGDPVPWPEGGRLMYA